MTTLTSTRFAQENIAQPVGQSDGWQASASFSPHYSDSDENPSSHSRDGVDLRLALLARAIEHEIIPRLMRAHRTPDGCTSIQPSRNQTVTVRDVESFAKLVLSQDEGVAQACLDAMRTRGITVETIYLDLLAPVARYMGELWEQDLCDFTEVTIGLGRLHQVLRELSPAFAQSIGQSSNGRRILLLPGPGEQHTFGLVMVSEFFRRAGWDVAGGPWEAGVDPVLMVKREWFDVVGFSVGAALHLEDLSECIQEVRKAALNDHVGIMAGGPIFGLHPEYATRVGADCACADGCQAPALAEQMMARQKKGC